MILNGMTPEPVIARGKHQDWGPRRCTRVVIAVTYTLKLLEVAGMSPKVLAEHMSNLQSREVW